MNRRVLPVLLLAATGTLAGCDDAGVLPSTGATEPVQVAGGEFIPGPIPAASPDAGSDAGPDGGAPPKVDTIMTLYTEVQAGEANLNYNGDADGNAYAILTRFRDIGSGYWSVPIGSPDLQTMGEMTWNENLSFGWDISPGTYDLQFAAMDMSGNVGPTNNLMVLVTSPVPTGAVVLSLKWDSSANLDIHVVAPDGTELDPQHPTTAATLEVDGGLPPGTGVLDRDSNADCVEDGFREEDVVFADAPAPGTYLVRVDMFSACGAPSADFALTETVHGKVKDTVKGRLLAMDADGGGAGSGLFVAEFTF